ncbi:MAG: endonuclease III [Deltaproteobacteria bacterium]
MAALKPLRDRSERIVQILEILGQEQTTTMLGEMSRSYDPFRLLISTILSARTTDEVTYPLAEELFKVYPTARDLAAADPHEVEKLIRRIGFYRNKTKNIIETAKIIVDEHHGQVPADMAALLKLPGVGRKVAGCVLVYAFGKDAIPVDTHVQRLANRMGLVHTTFPEQTERELMRITPKEHWQEVNDLLVWYGKTTCKPRKPECFRCIVIEYCDFTPKNMTP